MAKIVKLKKKELPMVIFLKSKGLKRKVAAALAVLLEVGKEVPFLGFLIPLIENAARLFGLLGVVHATVEKNVKSHKLVSLSSFLSALTLVALYVPALAAVVPLVTKIAALVGFAGLLKK